MTALVAQIFRWIYRRLLWLLLITATLVAIYNVNTQRRQLEDARKGLDALIEFEQQLPDTVAATARATSKSVAELIMAGDAALDQRIAERTRALSEREAALRQLNTPFNKLNPYKVVERTRLTIEVDVLRQEATYLGEIRSYSRRLASARQKQDRLEQECRKKAQEHTATRQLYKDVVAQLADLERNVTPVDKANPWSQYNTRKKALEKELKTRTDATWPTRRKYDDCKASEAAAERAREALGALKEFAFDSSNAEAAREALASDRMSIESHLDQHWIHTLIISPAKAEFPSAVAVLAGVILIPPLIRVLFFFVLAPAAGHLAPIRIIPSSTAPSIPEPLPSAVSVSMTIEPGNELLVRHEFLQSSSQGAKKRTKWFLNPRIPFASIASGMFMLTRVWPESHTATRVVVSSTKDALGEVGVIDMPEGAAMVVQPRALVGVVKPAGRQVEISRHWRLFSAHAWLTLQLRYLAFHGPCRLILKGCRGIRAEEPDSNDPRLINQAATLAFSANLDYKTVRCETFLPYLRSQEALFNDLFGGGPGRFVYEELPTAGPAAGVVGRCLDGIVDAVLKGFGI